MRNHYSGYSLLFRTIFMAYFRNIPQISHLLELFSREDSWLICINADPDAMASALALKRIMSRRVKEVTIAKVNEITRPDNLAMERYCRIHMEDLTPELIKQHDRFALVDSQPSHHPDFAHIPFSVIIDHHPLPEEPTPYPDVPYWSINPHYGANATLLIEHLYNLKIRPGKLLATALQYAIKTDTKNFERHATDVDLRAFQYVSRFADKTILNRIARSEFHLDWLKYFATACNNTYSLKNGLLSYIGEVENSELVVNIADFFTRVYEANWVAVGAVHNDKVIVVFRSDGVSKDVGKYAAELFGHLGSAGGHKTMARAEFTIDHCGEQSPEIFLWRYFSNKPAPK